MTLFFILLIAIEVYLFMTKKTVKQTYPQLSRLQITRLVDAPFQFAIWCLLTVFCAHALSSLAGMIGEVFNVDNYIGLFGGGWLGMILRFMRSNGFIGNIQEPMVLTQYRGTIALIWNVTVVSCIVCGLALWSFGNIVKKAKVNTTLFLASYYLPMACGIVSFAAIIWGLYGFDNVLDHKLKDINDIITYAIIIFLAFLACGIVWRFMDVKKFLAFPDRETMTWQEVLAKIKISTDKGQKPVEESHIIYITIGLALVISGFVIISTLPASEQTEPKQEMKQTYSGQEKSVAPVPVPTKEQKEGVEVVEDELDGDIIEEEDMVAQYGVSDEEYCINLLRQLFTASQSTIDAYGGYSTSETKRFIEYSVCMIRPLADLGEDYNIGDGLIKVSKVERLEGHEKIYVVYYYADAFGTTINNAAIVEMNKEEGTWNIDNVYVKHEDGQYYLMIDYSKPADYYYQCPMCGDC